MKPQKNSIRRTIVSFSFALATALMTLYIQNTNKEYAQHADTLEASASSSETYVVNTID